MTNLDTESLALKIKKHALNMTRIGQSSHIGCVLSMADILAVLYGKIMHYDSKDPTLCNRDRFILSKGHAGAGIYAVLAECGFFSTELLKTHYCDGSLLSGHVSHKGLPGVEFSTGSLGHGLSVGVGMALAASKKQEAHSIYVLLGDGECDEGAVWEAALFANHFSLDNLTAIIDHNKFQSLDTIENTMALEPFVVKWESFGWNVIRIDGHDHQSLIEAFEKSFNNSKPKIIIADTIKGKGVSFMENDILWHYRYPRNNEYQDAITELENNFRLKSSGKE